MHVLGRDDADEAGGAGGDHGIGGVDGTDGDGGAADIGGAKEHGGTTGIGGTEGNDGSAGIGEATDGPGVGRRPTVRLGSFLARDGTTGASVGLDVDGPHAGVVFGKRGTGKSYTLGVLAEGLADAPGVTPVVVDPMGVFGGLEAADGRIVDPIVPPAAIPPSAWPELVGLDPERGAGSLLWRAVDAAIERAEERNDADGPSIAEVRELVESSDAEASARRAATNHLGLAASWDMFDESAPSAAALVDGGSGPSASGDGGRPIVLDLSGVPETAAAAVVRAVARGLYDARIEGAVDRLPWLLIDEAHAFFGSVADPALRTLLTRGRAPGVSVVCATQRPSAVPPVAVSQSDLIVAHRLTAERDVDRLADAEATYLAGDLASRLPTGTGEALVVDDATETAHTLRIRERRTPHGGGDPSASDSYRRA